MTSGLHLLHHDFFLSFKSIREHVAEFFISQSEFHQYSLFVRWLDLDRKDIEQSIHFNYPLIWYWR